MRVKICFLMLSVMMGVSLGSTFDISAYGYESPKQEACMEELPVVVSEEAKIYELVPNVSVKHIDAAAQEVEVELEKMEEENEAAQTTTVSTMSERDLFARLVMAEAGGEDMIGQIMVANVVLNRVNCAYGGDTTITDVIYRSGQFEPVSTGRIWSVTPTASVYEAVDRALAGEDYSNGALYFISAYCDASWFESALTCVAEHGGHVFYK